MFTADRLFRRDCVQCTSEPACNCPAGERCILSVKTCDSCPEPRCLSDDNSDSDGGVTKNSAGAIAGIVVGCLIGLGLIVGFLVWYKFRHRRRRHLQALNEAALEFNTPPGSPKFDAAEAEPKPPSITSTYGGASRRSNVIPIMFPFNQASQGSRDNLDRNSMHTSILTGPSFPRTSLRHNDDTTVIRDSLRDSEYSLQSMHQAEQSNNGVRAYDVAVQGIPNLIDVGRQGRRQPPKSNLRRISETAPLGSTSPKSRKSARNSFAALPSLPNEDDNSSNSVKPRKSTLDDKSSIKTEESPFDDSQSLDRTGGANKASRNSVASSAAYSANLPEEAQLYQGHGLL